MDRTPRSLLKGASNLLPTGQSLTSSGMTRDHEAKEAMKGFVKNPEKTENNVGTPVGKISNNKNEITSDQSPEESKGKQVLLHNKEESLLNRNTELPLEPLSKLELKTKRAQPQQWSYFTIYLIALNALLFLGIILTLLCIIGALNLLPNPGNFTYYRGTIEFFLDVIAVIKQFLSIMKDNTTGYFEKLFHAKELS
mmetsp:Transcript_11782/g.11421  ORF Transcript_11782/g.11421 Transcript_11782/m.11421 type:complete len:196 (+) Transcript_11782:118-705(+)